MKSNQKGFGILEVFFILLVVGLVGGIGWKLYQRTSGTTTANNVNSASGQLTVFKQKIPQISCKNILPKLKNMSGVEGDICYTASMTASGEKFDYVVIDQSSAYKEKLQQEYDKNCSVDCGGGILPSSRQDYIIRDDGKVEHAYPDWVGSAELGLESLTGCPLGTLAKYKDDGTLQVKNGRIGIHFVGKDIDYSEQYGSSCVVSIDLIGYTSSGQAVFNKIDVDYKLADPSVCASKDPNDSNANSFSEQCYEQQAGMRGDIAICHKTYFAGTGTDDSGCIHAVAKRMRDASICDLTFENDQKGCRSVVNEAKAYFDGEVTTSGL